VNCNEFFIAGFRVMQEGKWARIIPDRNSETEDKAIWL
jgi:hypothetical protein